MNNMIGPAIQCGQCKDVIQSSYSGEFVRCGCGAIFIDSTEYYSRVGGDPENVINPQTGKPMYKGLD